MKIKRKPGHIEAIQWTGENDSEVFEWSQNNGNEGSVFKSSIGSPIGLESFHVISNHTRKAILPMDFIISRKRGEFDVCCIGDLEENFEVPENIKKRTKDFFDNVDLLKGLRENHNAKE